MITLSKENYGELRTFFNIFANTNGTMRVEEDQKPNLDPSQYISFFDSEKINTTPDERVELLRGLLLFLLKKNPRKVKELLTGEPEKYNVLDKRKERSEEAKEIAAEDPAAATVRRVVDSATRSTASDIEKNIEGKTSGEYQTSTKTDAFFAAKHLANNEDALRKYSIALNLFKYLVRHDIKKLVGDPPTIDALTKFVKETIQGCLAYHRSKKDIFAEIKNELRQNPDMIENCLSGRKHPNTKNRALQDAAMVMYKRMSREDYLGVDYSTLLDRARTKPEASLSFYDYCFIVDNMNPKSEEGGENDLYAHGVASLMHFIANKLIKTFRSITDLDVKIDEVNQMIADNISLQNKYGTNKLERIEKVLRDERHKQLMPEERSQLKEKQFFQWYVKTFVKLHDFNDNGYDETFTDDSNYVAAYKSRKEEKMSDEKFEKERQKKLYSQSYYQSEAYTNFFTYNYGVRSKGGSDFLDVQLRFMVPQGAGMDNVFHKRYFTVLNNYIQNDKLGSLAFLPFDSLLYELVGEFDSVDVVSDDPFVYINCQTNLTDLKNHKDKWGRDAKTGKSLYKRYIENISQLLSLKSNVVDNTDMFFMFTHTNSPFKEYINGEYNKISAKATRATKRRIAGYFNGRISEDSAVDLIAYTLYKAIDGMSHGIQNPPDAQIDQWMNTATTQLMYNGQEKRTPEEILTYCLSKEYNTDMRLAILSFVNNFRANYNNIVYDAKAFTTQRNAKMRVLELSQDVAKKILAGSYNVTSTPATDKAAAPSLPPSRRIDPTVSAAKPQQPSPATAAPAPEPPPDAKSDDINFDAF